MLLERRATTTARPEGRSSARLEDLPLFRGLSRRHAALLSRRADRVIAEPGRALAAQGAEALEFVVVLSGTLAVERDGKAVATLGPGDWYGASETLGRRPMDATVRALTPAELLVVGGRRLAPLLRDVPEIAVRLLAGA